MKYLLFTALFAVFTFCPVSHANLPSSTPNVQALQLMAQLPPELPQRVLGLAYDGNVFWTTVYLDGRYVTLDPNTLKWSVSTDTKANEAINEVSGKLKSAAGICFVNGKLWIAGAYGNSFGSIDPAEWKIDRVFKDKQREDPSSQSYSSMGCDGSHLWIAWHWFRYDLPVSETQQLLKIDPETGKVVAVYPLPGGTRVDATHGLTWDGTRLWHAKDNRLTSIDPDTGRVIDEYKLPLLKRPSGLAWDGHALWIIEFDGKVWRLPFLTHH